MTEYERAVYNRNTCVYTYTYILFTQYKSQHPSEHSLLYNKEKTKINK